MQPDFIPKSGHSRDPPFSIRKSSSRCGKPATNRGPNVDQTRRNRGIRGIRLVMCMVLWLTQQPAIGQQPITILGIQRDFQGQPGTFRDLFVGCSVCGCSRDRHRETCLEPALILAFLIAELYTITSAMQKVYSTHAQVEYEIQGLKNSVEKGGYVSPKRFTLLLPYLSVNWLIYWHFSVWLASILAVIAPIDANTTLSMFLSSNSLLPGLVFCLFR